MEYTSVLETKSKVRMQRAWKLVKGNLCADYPLSVFCGDIFVDVGMTTIHDILPIFLTLSPFLDLELGSVLQQELISLTDTYVITRRNVSFGFGVWAEHCRAREHLWQRG